MLFIFRRDIDWRGLDQASVWLHLLVYAVEASVTTGACLVEIFASAAVTWDEKVRLGYLYVAFAVVPGLMGFDMFLRIRRRLLDDDYRDRLIAVVKRE